MLFELDGIVVFPKNPVISAYVKNKHFKIFIFINKRVLFGIQNVYYMATIFDII